VKYRGEIMQRCIYNLMDPLEREVSWMVSLNVSLEQAKAIVRKINERTGLICEVSNINAPLQTVLSGHWNAIRKVPKTISELGIRAKAKMLHVSAPFHCTLMKPASISLEDALSTISMRDSRIPIISNVTASQVQEAAQIKRLLVEQMYLPVQWLESVNYCRRMLSAENTNAIWFLEIGPGKVLSSLLRQIDPQLKTITLGNAEELCAFFRTMQSPPATQ